MKSAYFILGILSLGAVRELHAICQDGVVESCRVGTKVGTRTCVKGFFTPCQVPPDPTIQGKVLPKYYVLAVVYAPPGTKGGGSSSSVNYGSGSTAGTTVSSSHSFKQKYQLSVTATFGDPKADSLAIGASFAYSRNSTNASALDIKKTIASEINVPGPSVDGIDHDRDQIWLWLNPKIGLTLTATSASWTLQDGQTADIQFVFVGHLKNPNLMPPGVAARLQTYGITTADFPNILSADPFANGSPAIDPARYQSVHTTFPYEPPFAQGDPVTTFKTTITNANTDSNSLTKENEYTLGATVQGDTGFFSLFQTEIKSEDSWTWTNSKTTGSSTSTTESASATVGGPSFGYTGPTDMGVYYDVYYKTFLFVPVTGTVELKGSLTSRSGKTVKNQEVSIVANGRTYRTFTNAKGEYRIREKIAGPLDVKAAGITKRIMVPGLKADIQIP